MPPPPFVTILQNLLDGNHPSLFQQIPIYTISDADIHVSDLIAIFDHSRPLGLSPGYLQSGQLVSLAIADDQNCRIIQFQQLDANSFKRNRSSGKPSVKSLDGRSLLQGNILCRAAGDLFAFDMAPLTMSLYSDINLRVTQAVDVQSAYPDVKDRLPLLIVKDALQDAQGIKKINEENIKRLFLQPEYKPEDNMRDWITDLAMRAWLAQFLPSFGDGETTFAPVPRIDTMKLSTVRLNMFAKLGTDALRLDTKKPTQVTHQVSQGIDPTTGELRLNSQNYNNKLRNNRELKINVNGVRGSYTVNAEVADVHGRVGNINAGNRILTDKDVMTVTSIGRDAQTAAEAKRAAALLRNLQGVDKSTDENPWIQNIYDPNEDGTLVWPKEWTQPIKPALVSPMPASRKKSNQALPNLNPSQQTSVNSMLSETDDHRITIIQGPPGTGKTSVIASFVYFSVNFYNREGIWLVAESNVAVKNIAEKLITTNFESWKLVVSKDFHFDWHEHLYGKVEDHLIRSDKIYISTGRAKLQGIHVILCTLSMLSNPLIIKFMSQVPLKTLVIDEASQIEIGNYFSILSTFKSLRKICFIGDNKQLPPYGQEDIAELKSIFEVSHLKQHILFLDTQYRMPPQIGRIISKAVYDNQLKSNPLHPITDRFTACYFLDVGIGKEEGVQGGSFKNKYECMAAIDLAEKLQNKEKNYKIITPYAAQTTFIETSMKEKGLAWEDKCFNVDSFQGNEEDFIIISVVRSRNIGFLNNLRRTNVMLSRCKKGMFIISSKQFLTGIGADTLVGKFLEEMAPATWLDSRAIQADNFLELF